MTKESYESLKLRYPFYFNCSFEEVIRRIANNLDIRDSLKSKKKLKIPDNMNIEEFFLTIKGTELLFVHSQVDGFPLFELNKVVIGSFKHDSLHGDYLEVKKCYSPNEGWKQIPYDQVFESLYYQE